VPLGEGALGVWQSKTITGLANAPTAAFALDNRVYATSGNRVGTISALLSYAGLSNLAFTASSAARFLFAPTLGRWALAYPNGFVPISSAPAFGALNTANAYDADGCLAVEDTSSPLAVFVGATDAAVQTAPISGTGSGAQLGAPSSSTGLAIKSHINAACARASAQLWIAGGEYDRTLSCVYVLSIVS
jgi:hypothetical protein